MPSLLLKVNNVKASSPSLVHPKFLMKMMISMKMLLKNFNIRWNKIMTLESVLYIKRKFHLQSQPTIEGLIVAMSLIGTTVITTFSGPLCYFLHCSLLEALK